MTTVYIPGLLLSGNWLPPVRIYAESGASSFPEIVFSQSQMIFPGYYAAKIDTIFGLDEPIMADIALLSQNYQAWYLLFAEASGNADLDALVKKIEKANMYEFGSREVFHLQKTFSGLDRDQIRLLLHNPPHFVVVTDDPHHTWDCKLNASGASVDVMIVEPFSNAGDYVLRINGDTPIRTHMSVVALCNIREDWPSLLEVTWKGSVPDAIQGKFSMRYENTMTEWDVYERDTDWLLSPRGPFPLRESPPFDILEDPGGTYLIRPQRLED